METFPNPYYVVHSLPNPQSISTSTSTSSKPQSNIPKVPLSLKQNIISVLSRIIQLRSSSTLNVALAPTFYLDLCLHCGPIWPDVVKTYLLILRLSNETFCTILEALLNGLTTHPEICYEILGCILSLFSCLPKKCTPPNKHPIWDKFTKLFNQFILKCHPYPYALGMTFEINELLLHLLAFNRKSTDFQFLKSILLNYDYRYILLWDKNFGFKKRLGSICSAQNAIFFNEFFQVVDDQKTASTLKSTQKDPINFEYFPLSKNSSHSLHSTPNLMKQPSNSFIQDLSLAGFNFGRGFYYALQCHFLSSSLAISNLRSSDLDPELDAIDRYATMEDLPPNFVHQEESLKIQHLDSFIHSDTTKDDEFKANFKLRLQEMYDDEENDVFSEDIQPPEIHIHGARTASSPVSRSPSPTPLVSRGNSRREKMSYPGPTPNSHLTGKKRNNRLSKATTSTTSTTSSDSKSNSGTGNLSQKTSINSAKRVYNKQKRNEKKHRRNQSQKKYALSNM